MSMQKILQRLKENDKPDDNAKEIIEQKTLQDLMSKVDVLGISLAQVDQKGMITQESGIISGCGLLRSRDYELSEMTDDTLLEPGIIYLRKKIIDGEHGEKIKKLAYSVIRPDGVAVMDSILEGVDATLTLDTLQTFKSDILLATTKNGDTLSGKPTQFHQLEPFARNKDAIILVENELYFFDLKAQSITKIEKTTTNQDAFEQLKKAIPETYRLAKEEQRQQITLLTGRQPDPEVTPDTVFGAASLSKPVFAYLVLQLIEANKPSKTRPEVGQFSQPFDLDTPLYTVFPEILEKFSDHQLEWAKELTARMVLSHTTGLSMVHDDRLGPIQLHFKPGTQYGYSGPGMAYLQEVIEELTQSNLETLAQEYVFKPCKMHHSAFGFPPQYSAVKMFDAKPSLEQMKDDEIAMCRTESHLKAYWLENGKIIHFSFPKEKVQALDERLPNSGEMSEDVQLIKAIASKYGCPKPQGANGLKTTASDYANFIWEWINDDSLAYAFEPQPASSFVTASPPGFIDTEHLPEQAQKNFQKGKEHVAWGLGLGLQIDDRGNLKAYHTGDMNEWRGWVAINLSDESKSAIVYFSNSHNGHCLAEPILSPNGEMNHVLDSFFPFYGFARSETELHGVINFHGVDPSRFKPFIQAQKQLDTEPLNGSTYRSHSLF